MDYKFAESLDCAEAFKECLYPMLGQAWYNDDMTLYELIQDTLMSIRKWEAIVSKRKVESENDGA